MINGAHFLLYSADAEADRTFFRDVFKFRSVDAGGGWLIFALPPAEIAVHPADGDSTQLLERSPVPEAELYLMCDDLNEVISSLREANVQCGEVQEERWGVRTTVPLPSGGQLGLYQPFHPTANGNPAG